MFWQIGCKKLCKHNLCGKIYWLKKFLANKVQTTNDKFQGNNMSIIPKPQQYEKISGSFVIDGNSTIYCQQPFKAQAQRFAQLVKQSCNLDVNFTDDISLATIIFNQKPCENSQYIVMISEGVATVTAGDESGYFYAVETLRQLFDLDEKHNGQCQCNNCYILDKPKFDYRSLHVDICRHFFGVEELQNIIQLMSRVKLNKLHLHLSDDQGFRVEIEKYPLLNTVGSVRYGSEVVKNGKRYVEDGICQGYLTKQQIRDLVVFAEQHQVEIVPEIDVPGHCVAMLTAYPEYSCTGEVSEVRKRWGISTDLLCAGNEQTYSFVKDVLDEVVELFPGKYFHLGGDETPKDRWCNCPKCRQMLADLHLENFDELQNHMVDVFRQHLQQKGKTVIYWNDGITKNTSQDVISQVWKMGTRKKGQKQANDGRKTIMSPFFDLYFDYPYAMTPFAKTYRFNPLRGIKPANKNNVLGVEGCLWAEYIATREKLYFNMLPRMLALAEVAWGTNNGYLEFCTRVKNYQKLYDKLHLEYNHTATKWQCVVSRLIGVGTFFKKDANFELNKQQTKNKSN